MSDLSVQTLRSAVVNEAIASSAFRAELGKDPRAAIEAKFGKLPYSVHVEEEQDNEMALLIPVKTEPLAKGFERFVKGLGERSPTRSEFQAVVIHRFWSDPSFASELRRDPRTAVDKLLQQYGANVPEGMTVRLYEEKQGECLIIVPRPIDASAELSEAELEAVAGGEGALILVTAAVVGAVATVVADRIIPGATDEFANTLE